jgi:effector-binding domain-containing protein
VVAGATTWEDFSSTWRSMLDEVYAAVRAPHSDSAVAGGAGRWQTVMLYKDDVPNVEVGVLASGSFSPTGHVITSVLPGGATAVTMHRGPYAELEAAHRAVRDWCRERGHALAGPRWEIYGHWSP